MADIYKCPAEEHSLELVFSGLFPTSFVSVGNSFETILKTDLEDVVSFLGVSYVVNNIHSSTSATVRAS